MSKRKDKNNKYSKEFKLKAVEMYLSGKYGGLDVLFPKLGLKSNAQLVSWIRKYKMFGIDGLENMTGKSIGLNKGRPRVKELSKDEENLRLRAENEYLKGLLQLSLINVKKRTILPN